MLYFAERLTIPLIMQTGKRTILEIGSSFGNSIRPFLEVPHFHISIIDPCLDTDLSTLFGDRVKLYKALSLEVLPRLHESFDCIFVDGDHNWYTVFYELKAIEECKLLNTDGIIFLHDVGWPYGRRDMYYQPNTIPDSFLHPYAKKGLEKGNMSVLNEGGFNAGHFNAIREYGPKNGVLTAIEDFLEQSSRDFHLVQDMREFGMAILISDTGLRSRILAWQIRQRIMKQKWLVPVQNHMARIILRLRMSPAANRIRVLRNWLLR